MNQTEATAIITYLAELWPSYELPQTPERWALRIGAWLDVIGDVEADVAKSIVAALADREFPPTPGMIRSRLAEEAGSALPSWDEFWPWVQSLAQSSSLMLLDDTAHPVLCPWPALEGLVTARTVADWARDELTMHDLELIVQAHVRRLYESRVQRAIREGVPDTPALAAWKDSRQIVKHVDDALEAGN